MKNTATHSGWPNLLKGKSQLHVLLTLLTFLFYSSANGQIIFSENFDGPIFPPTGWTNTLVNNAGTDCSGGSLTWVQSTGGTYATSCDFNISPNGNSGTHAAEWNAWDIGYSGEAVLSSPAIDLTPYSNGIFQVSFWAYRYSTDPISVYINTSPTVAGGTLIATLQDPTYDVNYNIVWQNYTINLPAGYTTGNVYVVFDGFSNYYEDEFIDDVQMVFIGPCTGTPQSPVITSAVLTAPVCSGDNTTITASDPNIANGLNNYWQSSATGLPGSWVNIPNSNTLSYTTPALTSSMYYRVADSCAYTNQVGYSAAFTVPVNTYSIPYAEDFSTTITTYIPFCFTENMTSSGQSRWYAISNNSFHDANGVTYPSVMAEDDIIGNYLYGKDAFFTLPALVLNGGETYRIKFGYERGKNDATSTNNGNTYNENLQLFENFNVQPSTAAQGSPGGTNLFNTTVSTEGHNVASLTFTPLTTGAYFFSWYSNTPHPAMGTPQAIFDVGGLIAVDSIAIDSFGCEVPQITFQPQNGGVCKGGSTTLSVTASGYKLTYQWYKDGFAITGATASQYTIAAAQAGDAGNYKVAVTGTCGGVTILQSNTIVLSVSDYPTDTLITNTSTAFCAGDSVRLIASAVGGNNYQWMLDGNFIPNAFDTGYTATISGSYQSVVTNPTGCATTSQAIQVSVLSASSVTVSPSGPTTFCNGGNVTLVANYDPAVHYQWLNNNLPTAPGDTLNSLTIGAAGNYTIQETGGNNCIVQFPTPINVIVNGPASPPALSATGPLSFCLGGFVTLSTPVLSVPGYTYQWYQNGAAITGETNTTYTASATGTYYVNVIQNNCALGSVVDTVNVDAPPTAIGNNGTIICSGNTIVLTAPGGPGTLAYQWLSNGIPTSVNTQVLTTDTGGSYQVQVTDSASCTAVSSVVNVVVGAPPVAVILALGPTIFCPGGNVSLKANYDTSLTYTWNVSPSGLPGTYSFYSSGHSDSIETVSSSGYYTVTEANGPCISTSAPVQVVVSPKPLPTITSSGSTVLCPGGSVTLNTPVVNNLTYQWYTVSGSVLSLIPGAITPNYLANSAGVYEVLATNPIGCTGSSTPVNVTSAPTPVSVITTVGRDSICLGNTVVLDAGSVSAYSYQWLLNNSPIAPATGSTYTASTAGSYSVVVTSSAGCVSTSAPTTITVLPVPPANLFSSGSTTFCSGDSVILSAATGSGLSYQWQMNYASISGATASSYTATAPGQYRVILSNGLCPVASVATQVTVNTPPTVNITSSGSNNVCVGSSVTLTASSLPGYSFQWKKNGYNIPNAVNAFYTANATGDYTVVAATNNCSSTSAPQHVTVNALPQAAVGLDVSDFPATKNPACVGSPAELYDVDEYAGFTYVWKLNGGNLTGATNYSYPALDSGLYTVTVTDTNGCTSTSASYYVGLLPLPDPVVIHNGNGTVLSTGTFVSYLWYYNDVATPQDTTNSIVINKSGKYKVTVTDGNGCTGTSDDIYVTGVGVVNVKAINVNIYPNPATSIVHIDAPVRVNVSISGLDGKEIMRGEGVTQMDLSQLASGVYMITVFDENNTVIKVDKLVKMGS